MTMWTLCAITEDFNAAFAYGWCGVIFGVPSILCARHAFVLLAKHNAYTGYKSTMGIEKGSEKEMLMDRFHNKYNK